MKGPYSKQTVVYYPGQTDRSYYKDHTWYRTDNGQKFRCPLPRSMIVAETVRPALYSRDCINSAVAYYAATQWGRSGMVGSSMTAVENKVYNKFKNAVSTTSSLGVNIVEYKQTLGMIQNTLAALRSPLKTFALQARRYAQQAKNKNLFRTALKDTGDAWLAFHFGVEPLIKDFHATLERLEQQHTNSSWKRIVVHGNDRWSFKRGDYSLYDWSYDENYHGIVRFQADVRMKSPTLALLSDFGVINPATLAWELVPFSFVVDWFIPIGSYLNSFSDFVGYETANPSKTWYLRFDGSQTYVERSRTDTGKFKGCRIQRTLTPITFSVPPFRIPSALSPSRGATSISLLLQALPK